MSERPAAQKCVHEPSIYRDGLASIPEEKLNVQP